MHTFTVVFIHMEGRQRRVTQTPSRCKSLTLHFSAHTNSCLRKGASTHKASTTAIPALEPKAITALISHCPPCFGLLADAQRESHWCWSALDSNEFCMCKAFDIEDSWFCGQTLRKKHDTVGRIIGEMVCCFPGADRMNDE